MSYLSTAIGPERRSRTSGYEIKKGSFSNETDNLPQIIAILAEANTENEAILSSDKYEITTAEEAGKKFGYGSPIHQIARILRPISGDGVGGIPTIVFPLIKNGGTQTKHTFELSGTALKSATIDIAINGRKNLDFKSYSVSIAKGATSVQIVKQISDTVNNVLSSPVKANFETNKVAFTTKWSGVSSKEIDIKFSNIEDLGVTFAKTETTEGTGLADLDQALNQFEGNWITTVINSYGDVNPQSLDILDQFNGNPENKSGMYAPAVFTPFMAFFGTTVSDKEDFLLKIDYPNKSSQVTNVLCPAPNSDGFSWESAANVALMFSRKMQHSPESDINGMVYPDMPTPALIGDMSIYNNRDLLIKRGVSTVTLEKGSYVVQDLVTTYSEGEDPLQFNYCRNLNLDWNIKDGYTILEKRTLRDKVLIEDNQVTSSKNAIKPSEWKANLFQLFDDLAERALLKSPEFSKENLRVEISNINPNRFETFFRYKRTGIARIQSTTAEAGF